MPVMTEEPEKSPQEPDLELPPLLGFRRRKRGRKTQRDSAEQVPDAGKDDDPLSADPVPKPRGGLAPATGATSRLPPVPPPSRIRNPPSPSAGGQPHDRPVAEQPVTDPGHEPTPAPATAPASPPPAAASVAQTPEEQSAEATTGRPAAHAGPDFTAADQEPVGSPEESTHVEDSTPPRKLRKARMPRKRPSLKLPVISPLIAAVVTGLLVGLLTVVLTYLLNRGCEGVRGVGSCGRFGLLALLLIVAIDVLVGAALLKAWRLTDPTSTAFLGVGLMAVFVLLFLLGALGSSWMLLVIPLVGAAGFLTSWWVTTTFVEENRDVPR